MSDQYPRFFYYDLYEPVVLRIVYYSRGLPARIVGILAGAPRQIPILAGAQERSSRKH